MREIHTLTLKHRQQVNESTTEIAKLNETIRQKDQQLKDNQKTLVKLMREIHDLNDLKQIAYNQQIEITRLKKI